MLKKVPGEIDYSGVLYTAIHADWPNYPSGEGWEIALKSLGNFPFGTQFYEIDDIDRCKLLSNQNLKCLTDRYDYKYFHLAIWHSDLVALERKGYIEGVIAKSNYQLDLIEFNRFKDQLAKNLIEDVNGNIILNHIDKNGNSNKLIFQKPLLVEDEDEDDIFNQTCAFIPNTVTLTTKGLEKIKDLSIEYKLSPKFCKLVEPLIQIKRYDTAVREASLLIETTIKEFHKVDLYGQNLINYHITQIIGHNDDYFTPDIKCYWGELRTIFKFIRNDFAHNFKIMDEDQCKMILCRINEVFLEFIEVVNKEDKP